MPSITAATRTFAVAGPTASTAPFRLEPHRGFKPAVKVVDNFGDNYGWAATPPMDVLGLVRRGLTNAQIGERLYISPKTAEHHVGRVLGKLGIRSRAEAAVLSIVAGI